MSAPIPIRSGSRSRSGSPPTQFDMRQCPYDPAHTVQNGTRLQSHLKKCRQAKLADTRSPYHARALKMWICPYSTLHHIHKDVFEEHKRNCDMKLVSDYAVPDEVPAWKLRRAKVTEADTADEDWEAEADVEVTYNPKEKIDAAAGMILHNPIGRTQSERRRFRQKSRLARYGGESAWEKDELPLFPGLHKQKRNRTKLKTGNIIYAAASAAANYCSNSCILYFQFNVLMFNFTF